MDNHKNELLVVLSLYFQYKYSCYKAYTALAIKNNLNAYLIIRKNKHLIVLLDLIKTYTFNFVFF
ncbi:hypothetical protein UA31_11180 [Photobacterium angustum]|nr:hypothetical protein UB36_11175 [Photobacterium damselae subsp. damselae]KJG30935.1 hypothetical protein UA69_10125 [Photobacterium angustum]KJG45242.1 hypothetical protein UA31_11180 [Photobacterium angustum]